MIQLNNFFNNNHGLKIKLKCLKRRVSQKIIEKRQNDDPMVSYLKIMAKYENSMSKCFLNKCFSGHAH